jgi:peptidoglycan/xylan/chitin deacetylase (PgdA/CDA1 family)
MNWFKDALLGGLSFLGMPQNRAVILMYHSVSAGADYFMNVEPQDFERQMKYIADSGREVISLSELVSRLRSGAQLGGSIAITFDDGYLDNYTNAFPELKKHGFPATIFVVTDCIGLQDKRGFPRLNAQQMKEMESSGLIDIEPHTKAHPHLSKLPAPEARAEIVGSKEKLEELLEKTCRHFAYPYGDFNTEIRGLVRESGLESAVSVREGSVEPGADILALPRVSVDSSTTFAQFRGKLTRAVDVYERLKQIV